MMKIHLQPAYPPTPFILTRHQLPLFLSSEIDNLLDDSIGEKARESSSQRSSTEEEPLPERHLVGAVPHCQIVCHTGVQASFSNAKEDAHGQEAMIIRYNT